MTQPLESSSMLLSRNRQSLPYMPDFMRNSKNPVDQLDLASKQFDNRKVIQTLKDNPEIHASKPQLLDDYLNRYERIVAKK
jgi:hypothetical protein